MAPGVELGECGRALLPDSLTPSDRGSTPEISSASRLCNKPLRHITASTETALLRCCVVAMVGAAVQSSDGANEFGEGLRDPMPRIDVGGQFVMTTVEILDKGVSRADYSR